MSEKERDLSRLRAVRGGNRAVITKLINETSTILEEEQPNKRRLQTINELLDEKTRIVKELDEKIVELTDVGDIPGEIEEAADLNSRILDIQREVKDVLDKATQPRQESTTKVCAVSQSSTSQQASVSTSPTSPSNVNTTNINTESIVTVSQSQLSQESLNVASDAPTTAQFRTKLPKLHLPMFKGDITHWRTFWDSFNSAVHSNLLLSNVEKFNHLNSLLEGQAKRCIQGLTLSDQNYQAAVNLLQQRFGNQQLIISSHMDELLKIPTCMGDKASHLRYVYDRITIHVRGLEALGVQASQYGSLLIPVVMSKLPQDIRLQIARKTSKEVWEISELLDVIRVEVEAREMSEGVKALYNEKVKHQSKIPSASSLVANNGPYKSKLCCVYCGDDHFSASCQKVTDKRARTEILRKEQRCFVCLMFGHKGSQCDPKKYCRKCRGRHHQSICQSQPRQSGNQPPSPSTGVLNSEVKPFVPSSTAPTYNIDTTTNATAQAQPTTTANSKTKTSVIMLQTASATAVSEDGSHSVPVKILFDSGSQRSYVSEKLKSKLGLKSHGVETLHLNTFGEGKFRRQKCELLKLRLCTSDNQIVTINALSFPVICSPISGTVELEDHFHLQGLNRADKSNVDAPIDILIGSDYYWDVVKDETIRGESGLVAINSKFGWLLSGPANRVSRDLTTATQLIISGSSQSPLETSEDTIVDTLRQFWETESVGIKDSKRLDSSVFNESVRFNGERYEVDLPWKDEMPRLPSDYNLCAKRLKSLQRKLLSRPELLHEYDEIIREQLQSGVIEQITETDEVNPETDTIHYLPHHAVIRSDHDTTKIRIVYDGSSKTPDRDYSMNDCLEVGPNFTPQLVDILLKFRWHNVGVTADIEKAFLMVAVSKSDQDMLRFLWLKNPTDPNSEILQFRFTRLLFGLRPSPAILGSTIRHHLDTQNDVSPELIDLLKNSFYVDDFVSGGNDDEEALELASKTKTVMEKGAFNLRKWNTNSPALQQRLSSNNDKLTKATPESLNGVKVVEDDQSYSESVTGTSTSVTSNSVKVLGSVWNTSTDELEFNFSGLINQARSLPPSKRSLLRVIGKIFDPLGLLSPFVIRWKVLFQVLCSEKIDWDHTLENEYLNLWNILISDLEHLNSVRVPRCYFCKNDSSKTIQLHCFSDASKSGYAAVVYIRSCYFNGDLDVNLVTAKTRVAPLQRQSIPRLELLGATILARLAANVKTALNLPEDVLVFYWIDSMTVLYWIKNVKPWKQYVMSRVAEIRELTDQRGWRHCPGKQNPADLPSRGINAHELTKETRWWKGPNFLYNSEMDWPQATTIGELESAREELVKNPVKQTHVFAVTALETDVNLEAIFECARYSTKNRVLRITALVLKFIKRIKHEENANPNPTSKITARDLLEAELLWLRSIQLSEFGAEYKLLKLKKEKNQLINQLNLCLDEDQLIRCQGRIGNSELPAEVKTPILLPSKHRYTELVIREAHSSVFHNGTRETLNRVREKYWILRGRESVKRIVKRCVLCKKIEGKPFATPALPALPESRVSDEPPFANTGLDFAGPLMVTENDKTEKCYICLFTCASTRAVHLELLKRMTADLFLQAFRRFVSRRGLPRRLISDNAKTFKAAAKEIRAMNVQRYFADQGVLWQFISERAPWHGGFWERLVKSVKRCLKKSLGRTSLTFEDLRTILVEIEATLNSRPLTYVYDDHEGVSYPLTPSCLIYGRRIPNTPSDKHFEVTCTNQSLTKRAKYQNRMLKNFTDQWRREYLVSIRESTRSQPGGNQKMSVGDVVILKDASQPRTFWKLARVEQLIPSKDNVVRSAMVKVLGKDKKKTVLLRRPIQHLVPLEVCSKLG